MHIIEFNFVYVQIHAVAVVSLRTNNEKKTYILIVTWTAGNVLYNLMPLISFSHIIYKITGVKGLSNRY